MDDNTNSIPQQLRSLKDLTAILASAGHSGASTSLNNIIDDLGTLVSTKSDLLSGLMSASNDFDLTALMGNLSQTAYELPDISKTSDPTFTDYDLDSYPIVMDRDATDSISYNSDTLDYSALIQQAAQNSPRDLASLIEWNRKFIEWNTKLDQVQSNVTFFQSSLLSDFALAQTVQRGGTSKQPQPGQTDELAIPNWIGQNSGLYVNDQSHASNTAQQAPNVQAQRQALVEGLLLVASLRVAITQIPQEVEGISFLLIINNATDYTNKLENALKAQSRAGGLLPPDLLELILRILIAILGILSAIVSGSLARQFLDNVLFSKNNQERKKAKSEQQRRYEEEEKRLRQEQGEADDISENPQVQNKEAEDALEQALAELSEETGQNIRLSDKDFKKLADQLHKDLSKGSYGKQYWVDEAKYRIQRQRQFRNIFHPPQ